MHLLEIILMVIILSYLPTTAALSASCDEDWKIDWDAQLSDLSSFRPFENPPEIVPNVTMSDVLRFAGVLWSAPSWQEITGRLCVQFGPLIYAFYPMEEFRSTCDALVTSLQKAEKSTIYGVCTSLWDQYEVENKTREFAIGNDPCLEIDTGICAIDPLGTVYANDFLEKASRLAFDLLKWLGPSPFSADAFGVCSFLRILMSSDLDQVGDEMKNLMKYLVADILEYMDRIDICMEKEGKLQDLLYTLPPSIQDGEPICDFLSHNPSQNEYLEKGTALTDNFLNVFAVQGLCVDMVAFMVSHDDGTTSYRITGIDLSSEASMSKFCSDITSAFSDSSHYNPTPYMFPSDQDINQLNFYDEDGQPLPNFSFMDTMKFLGAFLQSETLLDGGVLFCDVFESFLSEFELSLSGICPLLRDGDIAAVEKVCLQVSLPTGQHHFLRRPTLIYMAVTAMDMGRKYFNVAVVSRDHVCSALDDFLHSKNNLQSFVHSVIDAYLAELLPIADNICKNYDSFIELLRINSEKAPDEFDEILTVFTDLILTHLDFSDRQELCQTIASGIDASSGRTKRSLVESTQGRFLKFLTDSKQCEKSFESAEKIFGMLDIEYTFTDLLQIYTGYNTTTFLCEDFSDSFDPTLCKDPESANIWSAAITHEVSGLLLVQGVLMTYLVHLLWSR